MNAGFTELSMDTAREGDRVIVRVAGDLDHDSAPELRVKLESLEGEVHHVELDLGGVTFIDSAALQVFTAVHAALQVHSGGLHIVNPSPVVARILALTSLGEVFGV